MEATRDSACTRRTGRNICIFPARVFLANQLNYHRLYFLSFYRACTLQVYVPRYYALLYISSGRAAFTAIQRLTRGRRQRSSSRQTVKRITRSLARKRSRKHAPPFYLLRRFLTLLFLLSFLSSLLSFSSIYLRQSSLIFQPQPRFYKHAEEECTRGGERRHAVS